MNTPETNRFPCDCGGEEYHEWQEDCSKPNPNMPTQQEEKLQNEFMHFWDNLKKTVNIGDYSDEITNWWIKKISLAVAQREKEMVEKCKQCKMKFKEGSKDDYLVEDWHEMIGYNEALTHIINLITKNK